ncbi:SDR family oxidoreductase [Bosea sp. (in: a-proteobacteria)]|uniref:SDR family oxidoreductase n=1 Tax=Bosea sp. (in: a-proteobacteria) TaxID=1871050 RepID=UPI00262FAC69|nr:SDR family oxidoreductase [Bosea sp. (in: a-proteobacteria)]MCO5091355.1 SDR family oxidoreductase [Bosea sp. (in: a-proteobacteria)]
MEPLLIFGATRGVGLALARLERARGRRVFAMTRSGSDPAGLSALAELGVEAVPGDALDRGAVAAVFDRVPPACTVVSTIGGLAADSRRADDEGNINLIDEAGKAGVARRFVLVTSIGCGEMAPYRSPQAIAAFGAAVDAKTRAEERLRASSLAWTILRPGGLLSEPATGRGMLSEDAELHGFIHRADMAELVSLVLQDDATIGRAFAAVDAGRARSIHPLVAFPLIQAGPPA